MQGTEIYYFLKLYFLTQFFLLYYKRGSYFCSSNQEIKRYEELKVKGRPLSQKILIGRGVRLRPI